MATLSNFSIQRQYLIINIRLFGFWNVFFLFVLFFLDTLFPRGLGQGIDYGMFFNYSFKRHPLTFLNPEKQNLHIYKVTKIDWTGRL